MTPLERELADLKAKVAALEGWATNTSWYLKSTYHSPFIVADTYDDLQRINVPAPAFGFVRNHYVQTEVPVLDPEGNLEGFDPYGMRVPTARYFVRAYPPMPKIDKLTMPIVGENYSDSREWRVTMYQPSAGMNGALLYFDQGAGVGDLDSTIQVDAVTTLSYPTDTGSYTKNKDRLYNLEVTKWHYKNPETPDTSEKLIDEMRITYANGLDTTQLMWIEMELLPPWGDDDDRIPLNPDYEVVWSLPPFTPQKTGDD